MRSETLPGFSNGHSIWHAPRQIVMIRPLVFVPNDETLRTNVLQNEFARAAQGKSPEEIYQELKTINAAGHAEFDAVLKAYRDNGVDVAVFDAAKNISQQKIDEMLRKISRGEKVPGLMPDQIFPNCVVTFRGADLIGREKEIRIGRIDPDKTYFIQTPMLENNRQLESKPFVNFLKTLGYIKIPNIFGEPLKTLHAAKEALEGTGSVVLDRSKKIAFCAASERTHIKTAQKLCGAIRYELVAFDSVPHGETPDAPIDKRKPIYHTDLMINLLDDRHVIVYADGIADKDRARVLEKISTAPDGSPRKIFKINEAQFRACCANVQICINDKNEKILMISKGAFDAFGPMAQEIADSMNTKIVHVPIPTIEKIGGGSICCLSQEGQHITVETEPVLSPNRAPPSGYSKANTQSSSDPPRPEQV